jgi:hypothetical protein
VREQAVNSGGKFGHGAYKDESWSMQSYEKRLYAVREFYKAVLKGKSVDNPGDDEELEAMRASIVRVVGRKSRHVPKVRFATSRVDGVHAVRRRRRCVGGWCRRCVGVVQQHAKAVSGRGGACV